MIAIQPANGNFIRRLPQLEKEIGEKPAQLLLQIEYWIRISSTNEINGKRWTYQSTPDIQKKAFPSWSQSTINRAIKKLETLELVHIEHFNKRRFDKTRWFSLNAVGIGRLKTILLMDDVCTSQNDLRSSQNDLRSSQNDLRSSQNDATIPEITSENSSLISAMTPAPAPRAAAAGLVQSQSLDAVVDEKPKAAVKVETVEAAKVDIQETPTTPATTPIPPVPVTPLAREWSADDCDEPGMAGLRQFFTGCRDAELKQLVAKYGLAAIEQTIEAVRQLPNVENPPGLVKHKLLVQAVSTWTYPKKVDSQDAKYYVSGPYASFIRH